MHVHEPTSQVEDGAPFLSLHVASKCYASWCNLYKLFFVCVLCCGHSVITSVLTRPGQCKYALASQQSTKVLNSCTVSHIQTVQHTVQSAKYTKSVAFNMYIKEGVHNRNDLVSTVPITMNSYKQTKDLEPANLTEVCYHRSTKKVHIGSK